MPKKNLHPLYRSSRSFPYLFCRKVHLILAKTVVIGYNFGGDHMKIRNNFVLKKIAGSYVVVPVRTRAVDFSGIIKLTESGAFLWRILENGADREELIAKMLEEYAVDEATAAADIDRFVAKLREADLIE